MGSHEHEFRRLLDWLFIDALLPNWNTRFHRKKEWVLVFLGFAGGQFLLSFSVDCLGHHVEHREAPLLWCGALGTFLIILIGRPGPTGTRRPGSCGATEQKTRAREDGS